MREFKCTYKGYDIYFVGKSGTGISPYYEAVNKEEKKIYRIYNATNLEQAKDTLTLLIIEKGLVADTIKVTN